jgi:hypothetical protein
MLLNSEEKVIPLRRTREDATQLIIRAGELLRLSTETDHEAVMVDLQNLALYYLNLADRLEQGAANAA